MEPSSHSLLLMKHGAERIFGVRLMKAVRFPGADLTMLPGSHLIAGRIPGRGVCVIVGSWPEVLMDTEYEEVVSWK